MSILKMVFLGLALLASVLAGTTPEGKAFLAANKDKEGVIETSSGLQYKVLKTGKEDGKTPLKSTKCLCHYKGTTITGEEFDSSFKRGKPSAFAPNQVIKGWTEAMQMMKEGDHWELYIPSELAYGDSKRSELITPGAVLIFELELIEVQGPAAAKTAEL
ncbi:unnamed protein product [Scytosiphon promiscuus]